MTRESHAIRFLWFASIVLLSGCAQTPYRYGRFTTPPLGENTLDQGPISVARGTPHKRLDRIRNLVEWPSRFFMKTPKRDSYAPLPNTEESVLRYLDENDLRDVYVDFNYYDPAERWRRLRDNQRIAPGWKYTAGTLVWLGYTILPGRAWGYDSYDPFSNSVQVNSDQQPFALAEAAYAKDVHARNMPGAYSALTSVVGFSAWRRAIGVNDVVGYAREQRNWELEKDSIQQLYPLLGAEIATLGAWSGDPLIDIAIGAGGGAVGYGVGQREIARREAERRATGTAPAPRNSNISHTRLLREEVASDVAPSYIQRVSYDEPVE